MITETAHPGRPARYLAACLAAAMLFGSAVAGALSPQASAAAKEKIARIEAEALSPGETLILTEDELNSYVAYDLKDAIPDGMSNPRLSLLPGTGVFEARVDLSRVSGEAPNLLWQLLLSGERDIKAICRSSSTDGTAVVDVVAVEIDGTKLPDALVDWLISNVSSEDLAGFTPGEPFPLPANLRQVRLESGRAVVVSY